MFALGQPVSANAAVAWGLANNAIPAAELHPEARRVAYDTAAKPSGSMTAMKRLMRDAARWIAQMDREVPRSQSRLQAPRQTRPSRRLHKSATRTLPLARAVRESPVVRKGIDHHDQTFIPSVSKSACFFAIAQSASEKIAPMPIHRRHERALSSLQSTMHRPSRSPFVCLSFLAASIMGCSVWLCVLAAILISLV
jgi:hypothetical protein